VGVQGHDRSVRCELIIQLAPFRVEQRDLVGESAATVTLLFEFLAVVSCAAFRGGELCLETLDLRCQAAADRLRRVLAVLHATLELAEKLGFGAVERRSRYDGFDGEVLDGQAAIGVCGLSGE
jgi:hypothetical protein